MYKLIVFDMDGTIIDTDLLIVLAWMKLYQRYRPGYKPQLSNMVYLSGPPLLESVKREFPKENPEAVCDYFKDISKSLYDSEVVAYPGCLECMKGLHERGLLTAVNTNKLRPYALYALKVTGLDHSFDGLVAGGDVKAPKPAPDGVFSLMKQFKIASKEDVLYVGDTVYDLATADAAGVDCMLVTWGPRKIPSSAKPRYYCDDFKRFFEVIGQ